MANVEVGLFIGVESANWNNTDWNNAVLFFRQNNIDLAIIKIYEITQGEWYQNMGGPDTIIKKFTDAGIAVMPYGYFYGNDIITENAAALKYLNKYPRFCMNMEDGYNSSPNKVKEVVAGLVTHTGQLWISTWANPESMGWLDNLSILAPITSVFMPECYSDTLTKTMYSQYPKLPAGVKIQPTFHVTQTSPIYARPYPQFTLWEYMDAKQGVGALEQYIIQARGYKLMSYPTNSNGMIANYESITQFQPNHSEFECGATSVALNAFATPYNKPALNDATATINWFEKEYALTAGSNGPSNTAGASVDDVHTMIKATQGLVPTPNILHWFDINTITPTSQQGSDINAIKAAITHGYPVIVTVSESSVFDLDLGKSPYWWGPSGNHILTVVGIAPDGNLLYFDEAAVVEGDGNLQTPKTLLPQPRRYDNTKTDHSWATVIQLPWLPPIINGDPLSWPPYEGEPLNPYIIKQAQDTWASNVVNAASGTGIYDAWLEAYTSEKFNFGPPTTQENANYINWRGSSITVQFFGNFRCEWDGTAHFYDVNNRQVYP